MSELDREGPFQNPDTRDYWRTAKAGQFVIQRCGVCGAVFAVPRPFCVRCLSDEVHLVASTGRATVYARTLVRIAAATDGETGFPVVLIELAEGPRLLARFNGNSPPPIGACVTVVWDNSGDRPRLIAN